MNYEEIIPGQKIWTMVGSKPIEMEVLREYTLKGILKIDITHKVWLWSEPRRTTYQREPWQLFKTYEGLRDFVFPQKQ